MAGEITLEMLYDGQRAHDARFEQVDKRFEQVDKRFEQIDKRFEQIDKRFEQVDQRFEQIDKRFAAQDFRFDKLEGDVHQIQGAVGELQDRVSSLEQRMSDSFAHLNARIEEIGTMTRAMTSAVTQALADLSLGRNYDRRIGALETAVFGKSQP